MEPDGRVIPQGHFRPDPAHKESVMPMNSLFVNVYVVETDVVERGPVTVVLFVQRRRHPIDYLVLAKLLDPGLHHFPFIGLDELLGQTPTHELQAILDYGWIG